MQKGLEHNYQSGMFDLENRLRSAFQQELQNAVLASQQYTHRMMSDLQNAFESRIAALETTNQELIILVQELEAEKNAMGNSLLEFNARLHEMEAHQEVLASACSWRANQNSLVLNEIRNFN
jgi:hypothetical protein